MGPLAASPVSCSCLWLIGSGARFGGELGRWRSPEPWSGAGAGPGPPFLPLGRSSVSIKGEDVGVAPFRIPRPSWVPPKGFLRLPAPAASASGLLRPRTGWGACRRVSHAFNIGGNSRCPSAIQPGPEPQLCRHLDTASPAPIMVPPSPPKLPSEPSASIRRRAVTRLASCNRATSQVAFQSRSHRPSPTFLAPGTGAPMRL